MIDAAEAHSLGLVTWVKPADEIDGFVDDLAHGLRRARPSRWRRARDCSTTAQIATLREALANEARAQPGNFATADSTEAYAAFAEKRAPSFTGRWAVPAHARSTRGPRKEQTDA